MPLTPPSEVVLFLNMCGIPYPDVDEDQIREMARRIRDYSERMAEAHEGTSAVITGMGTAWSGETYELLAAYWIRLTGTTLADFDRACARMADALDVAARVVTAVKVAVLAELTALAAAYTATLAAAVATQGASAALSVAIRAAARRLCVAMRDTLIAYLMAEVVAKALEPLERVVAALLSDLACGLVPPAAPSPAALRIEPEVLLRGARLLDGYADTLARQTAELVTQLRGLDFTTGPWTEKPSAASNPVAPPGNPGIEPPTDPPGTTSGHSNPSEKPVSAPSSGIASATASPPNRPAPAHAPQSPESRSAATPSAAPRLAGPTLPVERAPALATEQTPTPTKPVPTPALSGEPFAGRSGTVEGPAATTPAPVAPLTDRPASPWLSADPLPAMSSPAASARDAPPASADNRARDLHTPNRMEGSARGPAGPPNIGTPWTKAAPAQPHPTITSSDGRGERVPRTTSAAPEPAHETADTQQKTSPPC